jgi:hypothetical protein
MLTTFAHTPDCRVPNVEHFTGRLGDRMAKCQTCGRFGIADPNAAPPRPREAVAVRPTFDGDRRAFVSRAEHLGIPAGVVQDGDLYIVRNLNQLDQLTREA